MNKLLLIALLITLNDSEHMILSMDHKKFLEEHEEFSETSNESIDLDIPVFSISELSEFSANQEYLPYKLACPKYILDEALKHKKKTKQLDLTMCDMTILPTSIENLKNLEELYICGNKNFILPDWLGNLKKLKKLFLSNVPINSFPEWIQKLSHLEVLYLNPYPFLKTNKYLNLPEWLEQLTNLKKLYIYGCNFEELEKKPSKLVIEILKQKF